MNNEKIQLTVEQFKELNKLNYEKKNAIIYLKLLKILKFLCNLTLIYTIITSHNYISLLPIFIILPISYNISNFNKYINNKNIEIEKYLCEKNIENESKKQLKEIKTIEPKQITKLPSWNELNYNQKKELCNYYIKDLINSDIYNNIFEEDKVKIKSYKNM